MLIIAAVAASLMIPASLLVRRPPALDDANAAVPQDTAPQDAMSLGQVVRSPQFIVLFLTNFFCCATHSGPIFHTVSYAVGCGIPMIAAVTIYSVEGLAGMGGRLVFGILGDRRTSVLVVGLLLQAFGGRAAVFVRELSGFYAVAAPSAYYAGDAVTPVIARELPVADDGDAGGVVGDGRSLDGDGPLGAG